jgi:CheY-like chemotaxis protein
MNNIGHILVVDDNPTNLKLVSDLLEWYGYRVSNAGDADQALKAIQRSMPDLVLMDIGLPGMDGLTLTRKLKTDEATKRIRVVALTAFAMKGDEQRALDAGCDGYIPKPINTRTLRAQLAQCLQGERSS